MTKLVAITLLQTCIIAGLPRSPVEGNQTVPEDDAKRLVEAGMAVYFEDGEEQVEDDGLDKLGVTALRKIVKDEGVTVPEFTRETEKAVTIDAIRAKRENPGDRLDAMTPEKLRETATAEGVEFAADAEDDAIIAGIVAKREDVAKAAAGNS